VGAFLSSEPIDATPRDDGQKFLSWHSRRHLLDSYRVAQSFRLEQHVLLPAAELLAFGRFSCNSIQKNSFRAYERSLSS
jgi:hypothetical protein